MTKSSTHKNKATLWIKAISIVLVIWIVAFTTDEELIEWFSFAMGVGLGAYIYRTFGNL